MRHMLANIICMFIWKKPTRDLVRTFLYYPAAREYVRFVREYARRHHMKNYKINVRVGYGCSNLVVILSNKYVFKFPLKDDGRENALREKRITDALRGVSPIKIPRMEIIPYKNIAIKKYEYAHGTLLTDIAPNVIALHAPDIAKQIAKFLYVLGRADPREIADLKPSPNAKPDYLYGWTHGDIWQNFLLDTKTFDITFFIDWESVDFGSMYWSLYSASYHWDKYGYRGLIVYVMAEYSKMYFKKRSK